MVDRKSKIQKAKGMKSIERAIKILAIVALISSATALYVPSASAASTSFIVNSIGDDTDAIPGDNNCETATPGECTLRAAIAEANSNNNPLDVDAITFSIPGSGVKTLTPANDYQEIIEPLSIDGATQGSVDCATHQLLIEIVGQGNATGLSFAGGSAGSSVNAIYIHNFNFGISSFQSSITATCNTLNDNVTFGIQINQSDDSLVDNNLMDSNSFVGIQIEDSEDVEISNNTSSNNTDRGVQTDGTPRIYIHNNLTDGNGDSGIRIFDAADAIVRGNRSINSGSNGILVDGLASGTLIEDNVVGLNGDTGMNINNSGNVTVRHNFIGVDTNGLTPMQNGQAGLVISAGTGVVSGITVGGTDVSDRNIIANSGRGDLVFVAAGGTLTGNRVSGNYLGVNVNGDVDPNFLNVGFGLVFLGDSHDNLAGGTTPGEANIIAGNDAGVGVAALGPFIPTNNSVIGNSIYGNHDGVNSTPGLDLMEDSNFDFVFDTNLGVTQNDSGDSDSGPNAYLNFPIVTGITTNLDNVSIKYTLDAPAPTGTVSGYRVEFYANVSANPSGHGDGQIYLGSETISGPVTDHEFEIANTGLPAGTYSFALTATAVDSSSSYGFGNTSEFSAVEVAGISLTNQNEVTTTTTPSSSTTNGNVAADGNNRSASGTLSSTGSIQTDSQILWSLVFLGIGTTAVFLTAAKKKKKSYSIH